MAIGLGWKEGRSVTDFHESAAPLGGGSWLPVHLIFYCWILKRRFCSVLFPECLQTYIDLPPQPFCPVKSRSIASPAGCWLAQCQPLLSLRGVWKHLPITSPWAAPGKPSSSFACVFLNQGWLVFLKLQKLQHKGKFRWASCCWLLLLEAVSTWDILCFCHPIQTSFQFYDRGIASLSCASSNCPQSPWFAHVLWCWLHYYQPTSQSISFSLLTTLVGGNDVVQIKKKQ